MSNCHNCVFKKNIPGDCHVACAHPAVVNNASKILLITLNGQSRELEPILGFHMHDHGVREGWATFPVNYDPIWMVGECKLFIDKKDVVNGNTPTKNNE